MSLISAYSSYMGVIPGDPPVINTHHFPLPEGKFITLHVSDGKISSKFYDYWSDLVKFIRPALNSFGYKIYQIGGPTDPVIKECDANYLGLTYQQSAYVQKQSVLHAGVDSLCVHVASAFSKKIVALYSHIYHEQSPGCWSNLDDVIYLEPKRDNHPCFGPQEFPKSVNTIKIEDIARSIFKLLDLPLSVNFETKFVGQYYQFPVVEIIPDFFGESAELKNQELNVRLDLNFDLQCAHLWAQNYRVKLISDRPVDLELLRVDRNNIAQLTLLIKGLEDYSLEYIKEAKKLVPNLVLVGTDDATLSDVREKFFDYIVERLPPPDRSKVENLAGCKFWTNKTIFSKTKTYPSISHWRAKKEFDKENFVVEDDEFAKDVEHFYIFN